MIERVQKYLALQRKLRHLITERVQKTKERRFSIYIVGSYAVYLAISLLVTVWVARTLHKNGRVFLVEAFQGNAELADSVNHLLVVGFYLVNLGYVALALRTGAALLTPREAIELESQKIGWVLLILGAMHFFNIFVFHRMRQRNQAPRIARATELI